MEFNENKPIYLQIADQIMDDVEQSPQSGGERIPSVRDYAAKSGVNANTVMRSYTWLQQEGIIYNQRGIGYFYSPDARKRVLEMRKRVFFDKEMKYFFNRLRAFDMGPSEIAKLYNEYLTDNKDFNR